MKAEVLLLLCLSSTFANNKDVDSTKKGISYEPVGCFKDKIREHRPLPILVKNYRWPAQIDWNNLNKTIAACAREVEHKGFLYFSLQFYGECWSGPQAHQTYYKDGESRRCKFGVGLAWANFVYRLVPKECSDYTVLDSADRSVHHRYTPSAECDYRLAHTWYRFESEAGNTMASECPGIFRCGTIAPGWLKGKHPTVADGMVDRKVCFHQNKNCCYTHVSAKVRNCGGFYVYKLYPTPYCQMRYCGSGEEE